MMRKKITVYIFFIQLLIHAPAYCSQSPDRPSSPDEPIKSKEKRIELLCSSSSTGGEMPRTPRDPQQRAQLQRQLSMKLNEAVEAIVFHKAAQIAAQKKETSSLKHSEATNDDSGSLETDKPSAPVVRRRSGSHAHTGVRPSTSIPSLGQSGSYGPRSDSREPSRSESRREVPQVTQIIADARQTFAQEKERIKAEQQELEQTERDLEARKQELAEEFRVLLTQEAVITTLEQQARVISVKPHTISSWALFPPATDVIRTNASNSSPFLAQITNTNSSTTQSIMPTSQQLLTLQNPFLAATVSLIVYISHDEKLLDRLGKMFDKVMHWAKPQPQSQIALVPTSGGNQSNVAIPTDIILTTTHDTNLTQKYHGPRPTSHPPLIMKFMRELLSKTYLQSLLSESLLANTAQTIAPYIVPSLHVQNGWKYIACYMGIDIGSTFLNECIQRTKNIKRPLSSLNRPHKKEQSLSQLVIKTAKAVLAYYISSHT